jgi:hypothetical protein
MTLPNTASVATSNQNVKIYPTPIQIGPVTVTPIITDRVLIADATLSLDGQSNPANRFTYNYTSVPGGYAKPHISPHLNGKNSFRRQSGHARWPRGMATVPTNVSKDAVR